MSRTFAAVLVLFVLLTGGGVAWFFLKARPGQHDIPPAPFPDLPPITVGKEDWPWWRGPTRDNHSPDANAATSWSDTKNIVWKSPIAGRGHSSPVLIGDRIFVTSADDQSQRQFLLCLNRDDGKKLWEETVHEKNFPGSIHSDNTHASSTPASDGKLVFVAFANKNAIQVSAWTLQGKSVWRRECGPHSGGFGYGSSLALWGPYLYVSVDTPAGGWIAALNRETGEFGWRNNRRTGTGSYGSPIFAELDGKPMVLLVGNGKVTSYNAKDGSILWETAGLGEVTANTATVGGNMIFASSGYPVRNLLALKADGSVAWKKDKKNEFPYPPSMLWANGYLYVVSDEGIATCSKADSGEQKWSERLKGRYYSSPLLVGDTIYACNRDGLTTLFKANPDRFEEVESNKLSAGIDASPVAVGGRLYIRTATHLVCIGAR